MNVQTRTKTQRTNPSPPLDEKDGQDQVFYACLHEYHMFLMTCELLQTYMCIVSYFNIYQKTYQHRSFCTRMKDNLPYEVN